MDLATKLLVVFTGLLLMLLLNFAVDGGGGAREGFEVVESLEDEEALDDFYADIYDELFTTPERKNFEIAQIATHALPEWPIADVSVLDIGCGTGHLADEVREYGGKYVGIDRSAAMIRRARALHPGADFQKADFMEAATFPSKSFSHVFCLYFTLYSVRDHARLLHNIYNWLKPSGVLVLHVVDPERFDPILDAASPFPFSLQKYTKERATSSEVTFDKFKYQAKFVHNTAGPSRFEETFKFPDGSAREQRHSLYLEAPEETLALARNAGFRKIAEADMVACGYEYQYLEFLQR